MFRQKTLFVVGAGASCEAKLPTGEQLKINLADSLAMESDGLNIMGGDTHLRRHMYYAAQRTGDPNAAHQYVDVADSIRRAMPVAISIDNFLEAHEHDDTLKLIGKMAIVQAILTAETSSLMAVQEGRNIWELDRLRGTWYIYLAQLLTENVTRANYASAFENVSFITFNYDRCIEHFLRQALITYYRIEPSEAEQLVDAIKIYHPYGSVGRLPWQRGGNVPYGAVDADLRILADRFRTFTEQVEDEAELEAMRQLVAEAETIVFLGFAFHRQNMKLLQPSSPSRVKRIYATVLDLSDSDTDYVRTQLRRLFKPLDGERSVGRLPIDLANMTSANLFASYWRSLSA